MILHINNAFYAEFPIDPSSTQDDLNDGKEIFEEIAVLLNSFSVQHKIDITETIIQFAIYQQKVTLDEFAMNTLFYDVINIYFDYDIAYSYLGGKGCDFSINITQKQDYGV